MATALSATGVAAAAVTLTIPAPGTGQRLRLHSLEFTLYNTAARTGSATPVVVTTTNLPGAMAFTFPSAGTIGTVERRVFEPPQFIESITTALAVTVICPATTGAIWRVTAVYENG